MSNMRDLKDLKANFPELTRIFKALSDENRLKLFTVIYEATEHCTCKKGEWNEEACIKSIAESLDITLPTVSHHIKELVNAGLITTNKKGRWVQCAINHERITEIKNFLDELKEKT